MSLGESRILVLWIPLIICKVNTSIRLPIMTIMASRLVHRHRLVLLQALRLL